MQKHKSTILYAALMIGIVAALVAFFFLTNTYTSANIL